MSALHDLVERVKALVFRRREEEELAEELRFHLEMEAEERRRQGVGPAEARRQSAIALGGVERTKEEVRDARGTRWLEELAADVAFAVRSLRRAPGFTATAVAMLAIGIGANTAIFTLVDAVVVKSLPVYRPDQLIVIGEPSLVNSVGRGSPNTMALSYPLYRDIRDHAGPLTGVLAAGPTGRLDIGVDGGELEHPVGRFVSGNYFSVLGVPAWRGRVFDGTEDRSPGGAPVATISYAYWTRRFHQDPGAVGRSIVVDNSRMTIVGVTPPSFTGEVVGEATDVWLPISMHDVLKPQERSLDRRDTAWLLLLGRVAPGVTLAQARADLVPFVIRTIVANAPGRVGQEFLARHPSVPIGPGHKGLSQVRATFETPLLTLMIGVAVLLCIICGNVANLLLARAIARGREMAVRLALGAERARLVRLLLTESLVLALAGAAAGLLVAWWGTRALLALAADGGAIPIDLSLDARVLTFTLVVSVAAVALFGLAPAFRVARMEHATTLRGNARTVTAGGLGFRGRRASLGSLLIVGQVALSVVLLVGAAMLTRSLRNVQSVEVGLDRDHLLILNVDIGARGYRKERLASLTHVMRERLGAIPGVAAVAFSENGIFAGTEWHTQIGVPGFSSRVADDSSVATDNVGPGYIRGIGGRLLAGRDISPTDEGHPVRVAVVNQSFAAFYFPAASAIGKSFQLNDSVAITIVGVMADTRDHSLEEAPDRRAYFPYVPTDTAVSNPSELRFAIRSDDPAGIIERVRQVVREIDPLLPIDRVDPLTTLMRQSIREERLVAHLASAFGLLALLLASVGLYGVMTYATRRRTGEMGLRSALGAQRTDVLRLVLSDALGLVGAGTIIGVPLAMAVSRLLRAQLHGVGAVDPTSIVLALAVLATSGAIAALLPALSAAKVSPLVALRAE